MELTLSTPALLFSTASLLMLGFTNRFMAIAKLIRDLHADYLSKPSTHIVEQLKNLRFRVRLIRNMQFLGVSSLFLSILCMIFIYLEMQTTAGWLFGLALFLQAAALAISVYEITISIQALTIELWDVEELLGDTPTKRMRDGLKFWKRKKTTNS
ncbi:MAG: DUF2721 domain-containing protein [Spirosomataceae bacterium]